MKKEVALPAIIGIAVVVIGIVGYFLFRATAPAPMSEPDPKVMRDRMMQGRGQMPTPAQPSQPQTPR